jgi:hypothetical protein
MMMMENKIISILREMVIPYPLILALLIHVSELLRLMGTAKDDQRKSIIRDSLQSLDSPDRKYHSSKRFGTQNVVVEHANVFLPEKVIFSM